MVTGEKMMLDYEDTSCCFEESLTCAMGIRGL
jgi:hypothetical protein